MLKSGSAGRYEIRNRHGCVLRRKNRRELEKTPWGGPRNFILGGSEQFGATWGGFWNGAEISLCHFFKVEKMLENEEIDFSTKIEKLLRGARYGSGWLINMPWGCLGTISGPLQAP